MKKRKVLFLRGHLDLFCEEGEGKGSSFLKTVPRRRHWEPFYEENPEVDLTVFINKTQCCFYEENLMGFFNEESYFVYLKIY